MSAALAWQYAAIAVLVAASVLFMFRKLAPKLAARGQRAALARRAPDAGHRRGRRLRRRLQHLWCLRHRRRARAVGRATAQVSFARRRLKGAARVAISRPDNGAAIACAAGFRRGRPSRQACSAPAARRPPTI
ncbi:TPA: DUF6587 family protein [Burkholderia lata]